MSADVLVQLREAAKWWNADEAEEPDVRRLFRACATEIERLRAIEAYAEELHAAAAEFEAPLSYWCDGPERTRLRAVLAKNPAPRSHHHEDQASRKTVEPGVGVAVRPTGADRSAELERNAAMETASSRPDHGIGEQTGTNRGTTAEDGGSGAGPHREPLTVKTDPFDCRTFHELCMDYRGATIVTTTYNAPQVAYEKLQAYCRGVMAQRGSCEEQRESPFGLSCSPAARAVLNACDALTPDDRIRANMAAEVAWPSGTTETEKRLRVLLAGAHGITYGDDGELQNNERHPFIDFKRDTVEEIDRKLGVRALKKMAESQGTSTEKR